YELHVGTFTPEGTFEAVIPRLESLRRLGITASEIMPVGQFPGTRGCGYDGVFPYAAQESYGGPRRLQRLADACHAAGLALFLAEIKEAADEVGRSVGRAVHVVAESDLNDVRLLLPPERGGLALDAQWSDDFHHAVHAYLTRERQGYYEDFGQAVDLARVLEQP